METLETMYHHNDFLRDIPPPLHASKLVSHILQDYLRLSRFRALINQNHCHPASTSNQCPLAPLPGKPGRGPLSLLSASFGHPLAAYTPLNSPFPGELDNANNLHLLLWMIAPPRCTSLLSSCVCDLLQNMGNHKSPYPLAGAIR